MGALELDQLHIHPAMSLGLLVVLMVLAELGSRFFKRMQEVPAYDWAVLDVFGGHLLDASAWLPCLAPPPLAGLRMLRTLCTDPDPGVQCKAASAIAVLLQLATSTVEVQPEGWPQAERDPTLTTEF